MPKKNKFYITTTLPYVNADPHIGFALEIIQADVVARFYRNNGYDVFFNTGTDEHGLKIFQGAQKENISPKEYCDVYAQKNKKLKDKSKEETKMAVRIRLRRIGKNPKKRIHFRVTVADGRRGRDSRIIEEIGFYNPVSKEAKINKERYDYWVSKGAQPSETVASLAKRLAKAPKPEVEVKKE